MFQHFINLQHFTSETPAILQQVGTRDHNTASKLLALLCASSEIQLPQLAKATIKMKLSDLMDSMVQKPKNLFQQCFDIIYEMFTQMEYLVAIPAILDHFDDHNCINVLQLLYRLLLNQHFRATFIEEGYYSELLEKFEHALQVPNSVYMKLTKQPQDGDFNHKFTHFLLTHYPHVYSKETVLNERGSIAEKSSSIANVDAQPTKHYKIPPLKLPTNTLEMVGVMTRSTRRADPFKSFSTNSNRFSHSIDSAVKFASGSQGLHVKTVNQSLDEEQPKRLSARDQLSDLAHHMGSYCLSQDLPSLLMKQRRQQLDSLARLGLNTIPSILKDNEEPAVESIEGVELNRVHKNRVCRYWGNIVYLVGKDIRNIQYEICPSNSILNYMLTGSFLKQSLNSRKFKSEFDCSGYLERNNLLCDQTEKQIGGQGWEKGLLSEAVIYYLILDLYMNERPHLKLGQNYSKDEYEESERSIESPSTVVNIPELMLPLRSEVDMKEIVCNYRHIGQGDIRYMNPFLKQFDMRFKYVMAQMDMNRSNYYEQECEQLRILDNYLFVNNRIKLGQFLDYLSDSLLMVKRQIVDYQMCQQNHNRTPHSSQYQSKSAKHYSQTINNMFKPLQLADQTPQEEQRFNFNPSYYIQKSTSKPNILKLTFIQKHPSIVSTYLSIVGRMQLMAIGNEVMKFLIQVYMNDSFLDLVRQFCTHVFSELAASVDESMEVHAMRTLFLVESGMVMLQQRQDKEYKLILRKYLQFTASIIKILQKFIESHSYLINTKSNLPRVQVYRKAFQLIGVYFSFDTHRASEDMTNFFIRYCYVNFIKLYSQSNLNDLREINSKIQEYQNKSQQPSSKHEEKVHRHWNVVFLNLFIKCLYNVAINRTDEVSRRFYQYRIVQFLTREIDLEFDVTQIRQDTSPRVSPKSNNSSMIFEEGASERLSSKVSDRPPQHQKLNMALEKIVEEDESNSKAVKASMKISQNLLKKVLVPKLDLESKMLKQDGIVSQSYSHSPQFHTSAKQLQNLTTLFKSNNNDHQQSQQQQELNHKRGNSMPFKSETVPNAQLSESQRQLLQKNLNSEKKHNVPKLNLKGCDDEQPMKMNDNGHKLVSEEVFYFSERKLRKIYQDEELHANCIALLISLLLKPSRGQLDDQYCSQHPIINGKPNILFLLHHHLNHQQNQKIVPLILSRLSDLRSYPVGQRLLKLLCTSLFDGSKYTEWQKIASGAYGVIYQCKSGLQDPQYVAIKQMNIPKSIYERCVLHGLFTEIGCMEDMRFCKNVATIYDYGVTATDYVIVMKKYPMSLKEWRTQQGQQDNMAMYLSIYKEILQTVQILHQNNITHYDIKADNILLDYGINQYQQELRVVLTDFGESKQFNNEDDEYCLRNRGTEYIKSPEMLTLTINSKKEQDTYDRRKKVGTTRSSDIWSLGCLLFEILTGELLLYKKEWVHFYLQVTQPQEQLITDDKYRMIGNNIYLIDFLKYVLVRDQKHRPNIESVLKRFEHVHALLVTNTTASQQFMSRSGTSIRPLELVLDEYHKQVYNTEKQLQIHHTTSIPHPSYIKLTNEFSICDKHYYTNNISKLITYGITNIISDTQILKPSETTSFQYILFSVEHITQVTSYIKAAQLLPHMLDYLKEVLLHRGKTLIIENHPSYLRQALLLSISSLFKLPAYETLTLINNQTLYFNMPNMCELSQLSTLQMELQNHIATYPKLQCICGCSTLVLKRDYNDEKRAQVIHCRCHGNLLCNGGAGFTKGCANYLKFLRKRYKLHWDSIKWGNIELDSFLVGPFNRGTIRQESKIQLLLNSMGPNHNLISHQSADWKVYECRVCQMWIMAHNRVGNEVATVMNNLLRKNRVGLSGGVRVPNLKNFNLYELK